MAANEKQASLFSFGVSSDKRKDEEEKSEKRKKQKRDYESTRERKFQVIWKKEFPWLTVDDVESPKQMFCQICLDHPEKADKKGSLYVGCSSFRKSNIQSHATSVRHQMCVDAQNAAVPRCPGDRPLDLVIRHMEENKRTQLMTIFTTAYHVYKMELPFTAYESLLKLQEKNGLDIGDAYLSRMACSRFLGDTFKALFEPKLTKMNTAKVISIMVDAATDCSTRDLVSIYIRYVDEGMAVNCFAGLEELQHSHADGYVQAISRTLDSRGIQRWRERVVGFGSDGAAVMVGRNSGLAKRLRDDIPWLVSIHCMAHGLELAAKDALKQQECLKKVETMLQSIYKQYHYSPKAWRELQSVAEALQEKVWKPTNLAGTRWLPHLNTALETVLKNYQSLVQHLQHTAEGHSATAEMTGRARQAARQLTDHRQLLFIHLCLDILHTISRLSLKLQEDALTLPRLLVAYETTLFQLTSFRTTPGDHLETYLEQSRTGRFDGIELSNFSQEVTDQFLRSKNTVLDTLHNTLGQRFDRLESDHVLKAAAKLLDPRDWPEEVEQLADFGTEDLRLLLDHFHEPLTESGCNIRLARTEEWPALKVLVKRMPVASQRPATLWSQLLVDPDRLEEFKTILLLVEILLTLPWSTASVERGFSAMKRIKSDWRAKLNTDVLSKLMYISIEGPSVMDYNAALALERWWQSGERTRRV